MKILHKKLYNNCSKEFAENHQTALRLVKETVFVDEENDIKYVTKTFEPIFVKRNCMSDFHTYKYMDILKDGGKVYHGYIYNGEVL